MKRMIPKNGILPPNLEAFPAADLRTAAIGQPFSQVAGMDGHSTDMVFADPGNALEFGTLPAVISKNFSSFGKVALHHAVTAVFVPFLKAEVGYEFNGFGTRFQLVGCLRLTAFKVGMKKDLGVSVSDDDQNERDGKAENHADNLIFPAIARQNLAGTKMIFVIAHAHKAKAADTFFEASATGKLSVILTHQGISPWEPITGV